jgi:two-component system, chemotaxis family, CheB/CheR fusion protein
MAFVLVQHLDPKHPSLLSHLLADKTGMAVAEATDGLDLAADHVYVTPPGSDLLVEGGRLRLVPREETGQVHLPIDAFLRSLAADAGTRAIGVVLSGAASDGTQGLAAIKSGGGVTFAQVPSSAEYPSMPLSAIGARVVDFVLPPEDIASELARLSSEPGFGVSEATCPPESEDAAASFDEVFAQLRSAFRVDFSAYKLPTIRRRVARRMLVRRTADLETYVSLLRDDPAEVEALYGDILIMVTEFFREPETFVALRERVIPAILRDMRAGADLRVWVPGCASGEEAYSLAITLLEAMDAGRVEAPVKIFATDISEPDLASAKRGVYATSVDAAIAPDLLRRYFTRTENGYQISKSVREVCVFARHDVTSDPPFPNLDLVSCRNLLIYLGPTLQRRVISNLHYGLRTDGYLVLGRSESIAGFTELFETVDKKQKVFRKLSPASGSGLLRMQAARRDQPAAERAPLPAEVSAPEATGPNASRDADEAVLDDFAPPGVTIDAQRTIVEFRGDPQPYLKIRAGRPSLNLPDMVRDELRGKVRAVVAEAERSGARASFWHVPLGRGTGKRTVDLHAIPFTTRAGENRFVVLFDEPAERTGPSRTAASSPQEAAEPNEADRLRGELNETRDRLEAVIQDREAANEELRAANEEMLSSGEEMQSVNEELETTQEELQSTNQELRTRNLELGQVSDDLSNLLTSVSFPIIMVGRDLRIRRFTPAAARLLKVIATDVGRLITDLRLRIDVPDLEQILAEVIDTMSLTERDVQDEEGHWYAMQVRPYKTLDNRIDGAVLTLFDIDEMKRLLAVQTNVATVLQQHYVHSMPQIAGLELAAVAETAHHRDLVGGDFHDVFALPDGRILAVIGDVSGKGIEATGLAETTRIAVRTAALVEPSPDKVLRLCHLLLRTESDRFVTALVVTLDPLTGKAVLASAGHVPPVRLSKEGSAFVELRYGIPLGAFDPDYTSECISMARGDVLVLYTDGVVEARRGGETFGEERLLHVLGNDGQREPRVLVQRARDAVVGFAGQLSDDLQILALRLV